MEGYLRTIGFSNLKTKKQIDNHEGRYTFGIAMG